MTIMIAEIMDFEKAIDQMAHCRRNKCFRVNCNGRAHSETAVYTYPICYKCGIELNDLIELLEKPSMQSDVSCEVCSKVYSSPSESKIHFITHFYKSTYKYEQRFLCICCAGATNLNSTSNVADLPIGKDVAKQKCDQCNSSYFHEANLLHHKHLKHGSQKKPNEPVVCADCDITFTSKRKLITHCKDYHGPSKTVTEMLNCRICDAGQFTCRASRTQHEIKMHRNKQTKMYECVDCGISFPSITKFHLHNVRQHLIKKPYICDVCGKGFTIKDNLKSHSTLHTDERPFKCELCPNYYKSIYQRNRHVKLRHTLERRFKCDQCAKTYKDSTDLRRHRRVHGGCEKKFQCPLCGNKYFENKHLNVHLKSHEKCVLN